MTISLAYLYFCELNTFYMKTIILFIALTASGFVTAQNNVDTTVKVLDSITDGWKLEALYGVNGTQTSFVNWNSGGRNNISVLGYISAIANLEKNDFKWDSDIDISLGGLQYIGKGNGGEGLQKTDDKLQISSTFGHSLKNNKKFYVSLVTGFKTQFLDGFVYPNDSVRVSSFMAPGYFNLALGFDYTPNKNLTLFVSPLAGKWTVVKDDILANAGSFGVDPAVYDGLGALIEAGRHLRSEFGAYTKFTYKKEIVKNIEMKSSVELFSNYLEHPENIDVNADVLFTFKVNNWFSASLNWTLIYDHDIDILDNNGGFGPRTQFKSVLGLGVSYTMKNIEGKEKKK